MTLAKFNGRYLKVISETIYIKGINQITEKKQEKSYRRESIFLYGKLDGRQIRRDTADVVTGELPFELRRDGDRYQKRPRQPWRGAWFMAARASISAASVLSRTRA